VAVGAHVSSGGQMKGGRPGTGGLRWNFWC